MSTIPIDIKEKIDGLRKEYIEPEDQAAINTIEANLRKKIIASKLKDNDTVKMIIEDANKRVGDINWLLANDETLIETERNKLFQERKVHRFWLQRFGYDLETYMKSVESFIDAKLSPSEDTPKKK